ncbi:tetratricopeptide repeat protein [Carboxylicivirga marina]|uniref:Tetratricopeptide repeat protein n=1 Tax=Carboxylicivirga marina TaxID=2800988 RepID=A0ABS1HPH5_9BACT|nr:hypothetical protein [Carboxylicivirga marina]MBK3519442.1 hypothetical protein [Carboxylicivirga marina]
MRILFSLLLAFYTTALFANINYIQFEKISEQTEYIEKYNFIVDHQQYCNHWTPQWNYDISKETLIKELKACHQAFLNLNEEKAELNLLLGDISHYLYNLEVEEHYVKAENYYMKAIELAPKDFRPSWFLANHYALSNVPDKAIVYFSRGEKLLPENEPATFWDEYAMATATANMPSHCIFAMDKSKTINGAQGYFEQQIGSSIYERIKPVKSDSVYHFKDIWTASGNDLMTFTSRPLGIKLLIDSTWQVNFYDYQNNQTGIVMVPPAITNEAGRDITYSIAILMKTAGNDDNLDAHISNFIRPEQKKMPFDKLKAYANKISYEIKDENMYQDMGGAHIHMIGIKRNRPQYPGLLLEQPISLPGNNKDEPSIYRASDCQDRFEGDIIYTVMLDVCEDIYDEAYKVFKETFESRLVIE